MCVIGYRIMATHGTIQMNLSTKNEVDTIKVDPTRKSAALVDMEDTDVARDNIKPCTFGYATK